MEDRRTRLIGDIDTHAALGVEIGALHAPVLERQDGRVLYVDYAPASILRASLRHEGVDPADVLEVDIVWGETPLADAIGEKVDVVVASHVLEHVPDLIGWLGELHAAMRLGATLGLAIPDRRCTFDAWRNDTTIGELVEAHLTARVRPSLRQVFEAATYSIDAAASEPWRGEDGERLPHHILAGLKNIYRWLDEDLKHSAEYVDVHCWVFTPRSFLVLAEALAALSLFPFAIAGFYPTEPGEIEFQVRLRACRDADDPSIAESIQAEWRSRVAADLTDRAAASTALIEENARLRKLLDVTHDSRSWALTKPLRGASRMLRAPFGRLK